MVVQAVPVTTSTVVVAVGVGKSEFAFSVTDAFRAPLLKPRTGCPMTAPSLALVVAEIVKVMPIDAVVKAWPVGWEVLELDPGHVTEQRRVLGKRTVKTDVIFAPVVVRTTPDDPLEVADVSVKAPATVTTGAAPHRARHSDDIAAGTTRTRANAG